MPGEDGYGCGTPTSSMAERELGISRPCYCEFAEGNTVTPRQVRMGAPPSPALPREEQQ